MRIEEIIGTYPSEQVNERSIFMFTTTNNKNSNKEEEEKDLAPALSDGTAATRVWVRLSPRPAVVIRGPAPRAGDRVSAQSVVAYVVGGGQEPPARFRVHLELIITARALADGAITGGRPPEEVMVVDPS